MGRIYLPRIATATRKTKTFNKAELVVDIDENKAYLGDGETVGGIPVGSVSAADLAGYARKEDVPSMEVVEANIAATFNERDYTSFRVYADDTDDHTQTYTVGTSCPQFVPSNILFTNAAETEQPEALKSLLANNPNPSAEAIRDAISIVQVPIPKSRTERFVLLSATPIEENDVVVDWGDGTQSATKNGLTKTPRGIGYYDTNAADSSSSGGTADDSIYYNLMFSHTYEAEGSYLIKIYGKDYVGIRHVYAGLNNGRPASEQYPADDATRYCLMYDCFGPDTHIASCVRNLASFSAQNLRLFHVLFNETNHFTRKQVGNWFACFSSCTNLVSAREFFFGGYEVTGNQTTGTFFNNDINLEVFTGRLPTYCTAKNFFASFFYGCSKLKLDIATIIPSASFGNKIIDVSGAFMNCIKLYGTVPADHFWNDFRVKWENTSTCFLGCSDEIRAQVPPTWGGTGAAAPDPTPVTVTSVIDIVDVNVDSKIQGLVDTAVEREITERINDGSITSSTTEGSTIKLGTDNLLGGYGAVAEEYINNSDGVTAFRMKLRNNTEMERFKISATVTINECAEDTDSTPETPDDNDGLVWGKFITAVIAGVDDENFYLYFNEDLDLKGDIKKGQVVVHVPDSERTDAAISMGDRNFVTGYAAFAAGLLNTAAGDGSYVVGSLSSATGNFAASYGVNNHVGGRNSFSFGGGNIIEADMATTVGIGNEINKTAQGAIVLGGTNRGITGIDAIVIGQGNSNIAGNRSTTIGFNLDNNIEGAVAIGASVPDSIEYKQSLVFPGLRFMKYRKELNPLYNQSKDPSNTGIDEDSNHRYVVSEDRIKRGYYEGSLKSETEVVTVPVDNNIFVLDPQNVCRYRLDGSGSVLLGVNEYMEDGDKIEVVFNAADIAMSFPSDWTAQGDVNLTNKSVVSIEVAKVIDTVFYRVIYAKQA